MTGIVAQLFFEVHGDNPREGPGSDDATRRAYRLAAECLPSEPAVLDVGCGPGAQTIQLVRLCGSTVHAVDNYGPYLDQLRRRAQAAGVEDRVVVHHGDMARLPFDGDVFDLIWSEGAIYILGFDRGLAAWREFLRPRGCMAVSELTWLVDDPPEEAVEFFAEEYPAMRSIQENREAIRCQGYELLGDFVLPAQNWTEEYYAHLAPKVAALKAKYGDVPEAMAYLDSEDAEREMYERFGHCYGYTFFVMRRSD